MYSLASKAQLAGLGRALAPYSVAKSRGLCLRARPAQVSAMADQKLDKSTPDSVSEKQVR